MKKIFSFVFFFLAAPTASAVCPVCTVAIGGGVGILRVWGVDDLLTGIWVGGLLLSSSFWLVDWLRKKKHPFKHMYIITTALMYAIALLPLYYTGFIGRNVHSQILGIDRLLTGTAFGTAVFMAALVFDMYLRGINDGKVAFPYQKVILPVSFLAITTVIIYFIGTII
ncbi:Uncharacterised protein [uncultured archaeon]|nr:Uncharacterised protein [uncultured archaeon]